MGHVGDCDHLQIEATEIDVFYFVRFEFPRGQGYFHEVGVTHSLQGGNVVVIELQDGIGRPEVSAKTGHAFGFLVKVREGSMVHQNGDAGACDPLPPCNGDFGEFARDARHSPVFEDQLDLANALSIYQVFKGCTSIVRRSTQDGFVGGLPETAVARDGAVGTSLDLLQLGGSEMGRGEGIGHAGDVDVAVENS